MRCLQVLDFYDFHLAHRGFFQCNHFMVFQYFCPFFYLDFVNIQPSGCIVGPYLARPADYLEKAVYGLPMAPAGYVDYSTLQFADRIPRDSLSLLSWTFSLWRRSIISFSVFIVSFIFCRLLSTRLSMSCTSFFSLFTLSSLLSKIIVLIVNGKFLRH